MFIFAWFKNLFVRIAAVGLVSVASLQPAVAQSGSAGAEVYVNGWNIVRATYDGGIFQRTAPGQWTEFNDNGATFTFEERDRNDVTVTMYDAARNVWLELDTYGNAILAGTGDEPRTEIYTITGSAAGAVTGNPLIDSGITGGTVIRADFDGGLFQRINNVDWVEIGDNGGTFQFRETERTDWMVELYDESRNVYLRIDIERQIIAIRDGYGVYSSLYPITSARR